MGEISISLRGSRLSCCCPGMRSFSSQQFSYQVVSQMLCSPLQQQAVVDTIAFWLILITRPTPLVKLMQSLMIISNFKWMCFSNSSVGISKSCLFLSPIKLQKKSCVSRSQWWGFTSPCFESTLGCLSPRTIRHEKKVDNKFIPLCSVNIFLLALVCIYVSGDLKLVLPVTG